ncbi:hypothetical protein C1646_742546 [Rhizophagus diaphanus]|nr:hypothetical protein C1646_742546 [Rhizophagus diaphanus] [Rhizophagus sp. MUCL 43196]
MLKAFMVILVEKNKTGDIKEFSDAPQTDFSENKLQKYVPEIQIASTSSTSGMDEPSQTDEQTVAKPEPVANSNLKPSQTPQKVRVRRVQNRKGGVVNVCQVLQEESIEKLVRCIVQDNLSEMEVKAIRKVLVELAYLIFSPDSSRLSRLRREL